MSGGTLNIDHAVAPVYPSGVVDSGDLADWTGFPPALHPLGPGPTPPGSPLTSEVGQAKRQWSGGHSARPVPNGAADILLKVLADPAAPFFRILYFNDSGPGNDTPHPQSKRDNGD